MLLRQADKTVRCVLRYKVGSFLVSQAMVMSAVIDDDTLQAQAQALGRYLQQQHLSLVTAESCSGGWIAKLVTDIAGSSAWFDCGMVVYSYEAK